MQLKFILVNSAQSIYYSVRVGRAKSLKRPFQPKYFRREMGGRVKNCSNGPHDRDHLAAVNRSGWFAVEQGLRQGCGLASLLFNIFFAAVMNVASTSFKADKERHHGRFGAPEEEKGGGGKQLPESQSWRCRFEA